MSSRPSRDTASAVRPRNHLVGESAPFLRALTLLDKLARCDATVLIQWETGTGKELASRAIHYSSKRAGQPFIPINCGAIADGLVESELFGAERGAFTDAKEARAGIVAQAAGGTLLLDEVDMLSPKAQVALLRFLEDREYRPVGGHARHADVRIIAASNRDLSAMAADRGFREDLLFRLNLVCLELPPLRDRGADVLLLAQSFLRRYAQEYDQPPRTLHADTQSAFLRHSWPGNVRELENLIRRQFLVSDEPVIRILDPASGDGDAPAGADTPCDFRTAKAHAIAQFEKTYLASLLSKTNGNVSLAARLCGKERSALGKLIKKHGIEAKQFRRLGGLP